MMAIFRHLQLALFFPFFGLLIIGYLAFSREAQAKSLEGEQRLNFNYEAELSFIFFDVLNPPSVSQVINQEAATPVASSARTLGLRRSVLDLHWNHLGISELHLRLRPDAGLQRHTAAPTQTREVDSRAGQVYRPAPALQLLDTYQLAIAPGDDFRVGWGVFEGFEPNRAAYDSSLNFGLETRLPEKFASYFVSWTLKPIDLPRLGPALEDSYRFTFWAFEGREDRRELLARRPQTDDTGPVGSDPYLGGAFTFEAFPVEAWRYTVTTGYVDSKVKLGRVTEIFGSISVAWQTKLGKRTTRLHWQSHWSRERWRVSEARLTGLEQFSHSLTSRHQLNRAWHLLLGGHAGSGQRHVEIDPSEQTIESGHKFDFGVEYHQGSFLSYQALLATEVRVSTTNDARQGAFEIDGEKQRQLNRFGLAVSYRIL